MEELDELQEEEVETTEEEIDAVEGQEPESENDGDANIETPKEEKTKVSKAFSDTIKEYLDSYAESDPAFKERYNNPEKNINDCCNYILNQVKKSGCNGFTDDEVFKMARDYYVDEIDPKDTKEIKGQVVVNHQIELTEEEKVKARVEAMKKLEAQILAEERKKREEEEKARAKEEEKARKREEARIEREKEKERIRKEKEAQKEAERKALEEKEKADAKAAGAGVQMSLFGDL